MRRGGPIQAARGGAGRIESSLGGIAGKRRVRARTGVDSPAEEPQSAAVRRTMPVAERTRERRSSALVTPNHREIAEPLAGAIRGFAEPVCAARDRTEPPGRIDLQRALDPFASALFARVAARRDKLVIAVASDAAAVVIRLDAVGELPGDVRKPRGVAAAVERVEHGGVEAAHEIRDRIGHALGRRGGAREDADSKGDARLDVQSSTAPTPSCSAGHAACHERLSRDRARVAVMRQRSRLGDRTQALCFERSRRRG